MSGAARPCFGHRGHGHGRIRGGHLEGSVDAERRSTTAAARRDGSVDGAEELSPRLDDRGGTALPLIRARGADRAAGAPAVAGMDE
jgi:hypothetical protein